VSTGSYPARDDRIIGTLDPDAPIYRIFPLWFFEEALRLKQIALISTARWEDPFEVLASQIMMEDLRTIPHSQQPLAPYLRPVYAQCWSRTEESDTLLRAYSRVIKDPIAHRNTDPQHEGVRVRSSVARILRTLDAATPCLAGLSQYVGEVQYGTRDVVQQRLANLIQKHGPSALGSGRLRAGLLLLKREAFAHEREVRLMCVDERKNVTGDVINVAIDPNVLFEEVTFDPRLVGFERLERESAARALGYTGAFGYSDLYHNTLLVIRFPSGWKS
jgi:hypothetical protein